MVKRSKSAVFIEVALQKASLVNAMKTALIVGCILNLINQGPALLAFDLAQLQLFKLALTFLVPFMVSTYASTTTKLHYLVGQPAVASAALRCKACKQTRTTVMEQELIESCSRCGPKTNWTVDQYLIYK